MSKQITGEQLRADIDAGRTGDKVAHFDPAAAPLETDAEAGGASVPFKSEARATPSRSFKGWGGVWLYVGATLAICLAIIWIFALAR